MRKSNIELMRIILFVMVVSIHISGQYLTDNHIVGLLNWQAANFLDGFSRISIGCFVLISGYFICTQKNGTKRRLKSTLFPLPFYLLPYVYLYVRDGFKAADIPLTLIKDMLASGRYFYHLWYINTLWALYLIAPLLNRHIAALTKSDFRRLLAVCMALFSAVPSVNYILGYRLIDDSLFASRLGVFVMLYFLGSYVRMHYEPKASPKHTFAAFLAANLLVVFLGVLYNSRFSPLFPFVFLKTHGLSYPFNEFIGGIYDMNSIFVVAASVLFFVFMLSLKMDCRAVNFIGKRTYGAYLIHILWVRLYNDYIPFSPLKRNDSVYYPLYCLVAIAAISAVSIASAVALDFALDHFDRRGIAKGSI